jgi:hypothetical protein
MKISKEVHPKLHQVLTTIRQDAEMSATVIIVPEQFDDFVVPAEEVLAKFNQDQLEVMATGEHEEQIELSRKMNCQWLNGLLNDIFDIC